MVEWGEDRMEGLADDRLHVVIVRAPTEREDPEGDDPREVTLAGVGDRWRGVDLAARLAG